MSQKSTHEEDLELLHDIEAGDSHAEDILAGKYLRPLGVFLKKNARTEADAQDLLQELFTEIILSARAGKIKIEKSTFSAYLYRAARYKFIRHWKKHKPQISIDANDPALKNMIERILAERDEKEYKPNHKKQLEIITKLAWRDRNILIDYFVEDLTGDEIKQKYGFSSADAARQAIKRLRETCRERVKEHLKMLVTLLLGPTLIFGVERMMESA